MQLSPCQTDTRHSHIGIRHYDVNPKYVAVTVGCSAVDDVDVEFGLTTH
jgi:hypothetical protein